MHALLAAGAVVNEAEDCGSTALIIASGRGHFDCVCALLEKGAVVGHAKHDGWTALIWASEEGHVHCVRALLEAGAEVSHADGDGDTALRIGARHLGVVQLICAYGGQRSELCGLETLQDIPEDCRAWLRETQGWTTQPHYFELLPAARVRALIVGGADLHASDGLGADSPTPLGLAHALLARNAAESKCAQLVVDAAAPWSPHNNALFPRAARARAVELLLVGCLLTREERFARGASAVLDVWQRYVMAHAVSREHAA